MEKKFMTGPAAPQGGFALALAAALLCLVLPAGAALAVAARQGKSGARVFRDMTVCAACGAAAYFLIGSWLLFGADAGAVLGLPPGASHPAAQAGLPGAGGAGEAPGLGAASFFLYHLGLALVPFWMFYAVNGERLTRAGNALMCAVVCALIFPVAGHWTIGSRWLGPPGAGWLATRGFFDAAGGVCALVCGAAAALAGLLGGDAPSGAPQPKTPQPGMPGSNAPPAFPEGGGPGWRIALCCWLLAAALATRASGGYFFGALVALVLGGLCGALGAKAASVAAENGAKAGLSWLASLLRAGGPALAAWRENLGEHEALGLAAGVAALSSALAAAPWWAVPLIGALAGSLVRMVLAGLAAALDLTNAARRVLALGLGGALGAAATGLVALAQPSLLVNDMFVAGGVTLAGIELTGAAATAAWTIAVVWLLQRGLMLAQRALAALPDK
ncbi:MAG: hypothetical protein HQK81_05800 [Desulfovibrionaceae bacterium]|nr:hypothetical protein [Desulfovibrionaceae bacterium]MBF0513563.1 hypothetical protein [Desulfovibrionaceae bacterium]